MLSNVRQSLLHGSETSGDAVAMCPVNQDAEALASVWLVFNDGDADRLRFSILRPRRQTFAECHVCSIVQNRLGLPHLFRRALAGPGAQPTCSQAELPRSLKCSRRLP